MFKRNQIQNTLVLAGVTLVSCVAIAQQTETTTATVTVQNAFTLTEDTGLSFGTITASRVSGTPSAIVLSPDGTAVAPTADNIRVLAAGAPATYTIAGAAPFTNLEASVSVDTVTLENASAPGSNPDFILSAFTISDGTGTAPIDSSGLGTFTAGTALTTDVNGGMSLSIGGTLTQDGVGADALLTDGDYTGQFTLTVQY